jgi:hypothetical protein
MSVLALKTEHNRNMDISQADKQFDSLHDINSYLNEII